MPTSLNPVVQPCLLLSFASYENFLLHVCTFGLFILFYFFLFGTKFPGAAFSLFQECCDFVIIRQTGISRHMWTHGYVMMTFVTAKMLIYSPAVVQRWCTCVCDSPYYSCPPVSLATGTQAVESYATALLCQEAVLLAAWAVTS